MGQDIRSWAEEERERRYGAMNQLVDVLRPYMELRIAQGIGHRSPEGKALLAAWKAYGKAIQSQ